MCARCPRLCLPRRLWSAFGRSSPWPDHEARKSCWCCSHRSRWQRRVFRAGKAVLHYPYSVEPPGCLLDQEEKPPGRWLEEHKHQVPAVLQHKHKSKAGKRGSSKEGISCLIPNLHQELPQVVLSAVLAGFFLPTVALPPEVVMPPVALNQFGPFRSVQHCTV